MEINPIEVGNRIKNIRKSKGLTLEEFGKFFENADKSLVSKWERGKAIPNNSRLKMIAQFGDISVNELLYGSRDEQIYYLVNTEFNEYVKRIKEEAEKVDNIQLSYFCDFFKENEDQIKNKTILELTKKHSLLSKLPLDKTSEFIRNHFKTILSFYAENNMVLLLKLTELSGDLKNYLESSYGEFRENNDILPNSNLNPEYYKILSEKINDLINTIDELYSKEIHITD